MTSVKYIGLDVHKESISICVRNSVGKVVMESVIETKASTILQFIDGLRGDRWRDSADGNKHVLYGRHQGQRFSLYVPEELVPQVQRWLDNGRALQELLYQAASRNLQALKGERDQASGKKED